MVRRFARFRRFGAEVLAWTMVASSVSATAPAKRVAAPTAVAEGSVPAARYRASVPASPAPLRADSQTGGAAQTTFPFFGPKRYTRTAGPPNVFTETIAVPAWLVGPYTLRVQNGEPDGTRRLSAASIVVNGVTVVDTAEFNQEVPALERTVTLTPASTMRIRLESTPGGYLTISLAGVSADTSPPQVAIITPVPGSSSTNVSPRLTVSYRDPVGGTNPGAAGADPSTLRVTLDEVDRTSLFAKGADEASADLAGVVQLTEGLHTLAMTIQDYAGNTASTSGQFRVDLTAPSIGSVQPANGEFVVTRRPTVVIRYQDGAGLDLQSLNVSVNGVDRTALFTKDTTQASATLDEASQLPEGPNTIVVRVRDTAGNEATATSAFVVDVTEPAVAITQPANESFTDAETVDVTGTITDSSPTTVTINGVPAVVTGSTFKLENVSLGTASTATFTAVATDAAGNTSQHAVTVTIDRVDPIVTIARPVAGAYFVSGVLVVEGTLADDSAMEVSVNGVTATVTGNTFSAALATTDGRLDLYVIARDMANNIGVATSYVVIDSVAPVLSIAAPEAGLVSNAESVTVRGPASDGSPFSVTVNGVPVAVINGEFSTSVSLPYEGPQTIEVVAVDAAGNRTAKTVGVTSDRTPPVVQISTPAAGSFLPTASPQVRIDWSDAVGINAETLQVLVDGLDRTSQFTKSATGGSATLVGLEDGPHHVSAVVRDRGGNTAEAATTFTVDTVAPAVTIDEPAESSFTASATVTVRGQVTDASAVAVAVNGIQAAVSSGVFTATVPVGDAPSASLRAVATDAAGNVGEASRTIAVDRAPPAIAITSPTPGTYLQGPSVTVTGSVSDASPHSVEVNGQAAVVTNGAFTVQIPATDGPLTIRATATDAALNTATAEATVTIDTTAPVIAIASPAEGTITNLASLTITGTVADPAPVTLRIDEIQVPVANGAFSAAVGLVAEGPRTVRLVAVDAAGNTATHELHVVRDATPPELTVATPAPGAIVGNDPVTVTGLVEDLTAVVVRVNGVVASRAQNSWTAPVGFAAEGNQAITVVAVDAAGNQSTVVRNILLDLLPPVVAIDAPAPDALSVVESIAVTGRVADLNLATLTVGGIATPVKSGAFSTMVPLTEGENHIHAIATDGLGRTGQAEVIVTRDSTPPTIEVSAPDTISRRRGAQALVTASDTFALDRVVVSANGAALGTFTQPAVTVDLAVPEALAAGAMLVVTATAIDRAGNATTVTRSLRVIADGVIVGQALADDTGLPLPGATVQMNDRTLTTDARGEYAIPASDVSVLLTIAKSGMTQVERRVPVESGVGTAVVDARLTPLGPSVTIETAAMTLTSPADPRIASPVSVSVSAGVVPAGTTMRLTQLSPQGLPGLLPLGWSPLGAFDLRSSAAATALRAEVRLASNVPAAAGATAATPETVHVVQYRPSLHAWILAAANVPVTSGNASVDLPALAAGLESGNAFAFVIADGGEPAVPIPAVGDALSGVEMAVLPATASSIGAMSPAVVPPGGGTALGLLTIKSPSPLPSGTIVQTQVTEQFTLASGEVASEETRNQDIVLYRTPSIAAAALSADPATFSPALSAFFPVTPTRSFAPAQLVQGRVHLDVLAGREAVRGQSGGSEPLTLTNGGVTVTVPAGALTEDTAISIQPAVLSGFLPAAADLQPLGEAMLNLSGATLRLGAELSLATAPLGAIAPTDRFLVARVERVDGVPRLAVVAVADNMGDRLVSRAVFGLPGVVAGGRYVFYKTTTPFGFAVVTVTAAGTPVAGSLVSTDRWPFVARTNAAGNATAAAPEGPVHVTARLPGTALEGAASVTLTADQMTAVPIALNGTVTTATVTPVDGAGAVPTSIQIEIATTAPIAATSVTAAIVRLTRDGADVAIRRVLAGSARTLAIVPQQLLQGGAEYHLEVSGLVDTHGGPIAVPPVTFRTLTQAALTFNPERLNLSFPDANGVVTVTAAPGSLPPATNVLIVNAGSGEVVTFTVGNDGSLSGTLSATIDHRLIVTVTAPTGQTSTFERTKYVAPDGKTAIGAAGGTIDGPGGIQIRVPEGATDKAVVMKIEPFGADYLPEPPQIPGANFGSGISIGSTGPTHFKKEVDLVFPLPAGVPANPKDAFYYVYRRIEGPNGEVWFENIDYAQVEGTGADARVVTASYPFTGYKDGWNRWNPAGPYLGALGFGMVNMVATSHAIVMWTHNALLPGRPVGGVIYGKVVRPRFVEGSANPVFEGVAGVRLTRDDPSHGGDPSNNIGMSGGNGEFTFMDTQFQTGTLRIRADNDQGTFYATAYAVSELDTKVETDDQLKALLAQGFFQNIAHVTITLPPLEPTPPAPQIAIRIFTEHEAVRNTTSLVVAGTPLIIGFTAKNGTVSAATINGADYPVRVDPLKGNVAAGGMDVILDTPFTPVQPGSYTVTATALAPFGPPVQSSLTFRVIAAGGGTNTAVPGRPGVLTVQPANGARGVPVSSYVQIAFSEPVTRITPESVKLRGPDGDVSVLMSGIVVAADGVPSAAQTIDSAHAVTSLTLIPLVALRYGSTYDVVLTEAIVDRDVDANQAPAPQPLVAFTSSFSTFGPESLGVSTETPRAAGIVALGDRVYIAETQHTGGTSGPNQSGYLRSFDVANAALPEEILPSWFVNYPPRDIAGAIDADGRRTVVVATAPRTWFFLQGELVYHYDIQSSPANLFVFDVTDDVPRWIGAATVSDGIMDGIPNRVVMKDGLLYLATQNKGIQVVDLEGTKAGFPDTGAPENDFQRHASLFKDGINREAVKINVPIMEPRDARPGDLNAYHLPLTDLKVEDYLVAGESKRLVVATGPRKEVALVVVDPIFGETLWRGPLTHATGTLEWGAAIATATIDERQLVLVGGVGAVGQSSGVLAVVDMSPLATNAAPAVLAMITLPHAVGDIVVDGTTAIVAGWAGADGGTGPATLVDLTMPSTPRIVGSMSGVGSRLALTGRVLFSTERSFLKGLPTPLGGVHSTALATVAVIRQITPSAIVTDGAGDVTESDVNIEAAVVPSTYEIGTAEIRILRNGTLIETLPATIAGSLARAVWPARRPVDRKAVYTAVAAIDKDSDRPLTSVPVQVPLVQITFIDRRGQETFAPATSDPRPTVVLDPVQSQHIVLLPGGTQAQVRLSGTVTDPLADIVAEHAADIREVTARGLAYPVTFIREASTPARPYPFKGRFSFAVTMPIQNGRNTVVVEAANAVGAKGHDSISFAVLLSQSANDSTPSVSTFAPKFLDPFSVQTAPPEADGRLGLVLYQGVAAPVDGGTRLVQDAPGSLAYSGISQPFGAARLVFDAPPTGVDAAAREVVTARLFSTGLSIAGEPVEFVETGPATGLFRTVARRLPTNDALTFSLTALPGPDAPDTLRVEFEKGTETASGTLTETGAATNVFTGSIGTIGALTFELRSIENVTATVRILHGFVTNPTLEVESLYMAVTERTPDTLQFKTQRLIAGGLGYFTATTTASSLLGVENNPGSTAPAAEPVWLAVKGLPSVAPDPRIKLNDVELELTAQAIGNEPAGQRVRRLIRSREPVVFVRDPKGFSTRNVQRSAVNPDPDNPIELAPAPHRIEYDDPVLALRLKRQTGSVMLSRASIMRGSVTEVFSTFIVDSGAQWNVDAVTIEPATGVTVERTGMMSIPVGGWQIKQVLKFTVAPDAPLGERSLVYHFSNGTTKRFDHVISVSGGRVVLFAIDGLAKAEFDEAITATGPEWDTGKGTTAFKRMFVETPTRGRAIVKEAVTTFPPITFTRWASIFSGQPPAVTGVPSNNWMNRQAPFSGGAFDQGLGQGEGGRTYDVFYSPDAYNRHHPVPFIYDTLRERGMRSIVINQQAGLGQGTPRAGLLNSDDAPDGSRWPRGFLGDAIQYKTAETFGGVRREAEEMDEGSEEMAFSEIRRLNGQFDLMVIYLPGLDHLIHGVGGPLPTARTYFNEYLHGTINRIYRELGPLRDTTVFGVVSDHGHYDTDLNRAIDFTEHGSEVLTGKTMHEVLQVRTDIRARKDLAEPANVVFNPQFGIAHVYVAGTRAGDWTTPPSVTDLEEIVDSLYRTYIAPFGDDWQNRPVAEILVRKPATAGTFAGSAYWVVPRTYVPGKGLENQLVDVSTLQGFGHGPGPFNEGETWAYDDAARRVADFVSPNTGDIVLLANGAGGFQFGGAYSAQHGSLTAADSRVPVAFGYPGAAKSDTLLDKLVQFLGALPDPIRSLVEAAALEVFFLGGRTPATVR